MSVIEMSEDDIKKLEEIYERYAEYMYRVSLRKLRNVESAKDCCQQSYEKLIRYIDRLKEVDSPETMSYIYMIVHSVAMDMYRKQKDCILTGDEKLFGIMELNHSEAQINRKLVDACTSEFLAKSLKVLTKEEKRLIIMRYAQEKTYEEISRHFGISEPTCRKRIQRIKQKLGTNEGRKGAKL